MEAKRYDNGKMYNWTIYKIVSPSGRTYIGKTIDLVKRFRHYKHSKAKSQPILNKSFIKYGIDAHKVDVIDTFNSTLPYANGKEIFWIRSYMSNSTKYPENRGMNLTDGGEGTMGHKFNKEQLNRLSESHKGQRGFWTGKNRSQELKDKISKSLTGRKHPENRKSIIYTYEMKNKVSDFMKGHSYSKGRKYSETIINNMRKAMTKKLGIPILRYDVNNYTLEEYSSVKEAARKTGISSKSIYTALKSKKPKYLFKYKPNTIFNNITFQRRVFKLQDIKYITA